MHTISIDNQPFIKCNCLTTVSEVLKAHRLGRDAHLPISVSLFEGHATYTVQPTERRTS